MKSAQDAWTSIKTTTNLAWVASLLHPPLTRAALSAWKRAPADRVIELERILGVPRERLRPDLYPPRWSDL
jgi:hypothetical protein